MNIIILETIKKIKILLLTYTPYKMLLALATRLTMTKHNQKDIRGHYEHAILSLSLLSVNVDCVNCIFLASAH
jgi:hypothetical protein